jgi:hypothetical protein
MSGNDSLWARLERVPREGTTLDDCQDAGAYDLDRRRFAVADGATESWNARLWAQLLTDSYVQHPDPVPSWGAWLPELRQRWTEATDAALFDSRSAASHGATGPAELDWFLEDRYALGAYATFLGVTLMPFPDPDEGGFSWVALALGDTCLFQVRHDQLVLAFPIGRSADFNSVPWLVGSRGGDEIPLARSMNLAGRLLPGDRLFLMTDALSCWFLGCCERGEKPWQRLLTILNAGGFASWVGGLRSGHQLRNDDTTVLAIRVL